MVSIRFGLLAHVKSLDLTAAMLIGSLDLTTTIPVTSSSTAYREVCRMMVGISKLDHLDLKKWVSIRFGLLAQVKSLDLTAAMLVGSLDLTDI